MHGVSVLADNRGATTEVVLHGGCGLLVDLRSVNEIVEGASAMLADPSLARLGGTDPGAGYEFSYEAF